MAKKKQTPKHEKMSFNRSLFPIDCENWKDAAPVNRTNWSLSSQNSYSCPSVYQSYNYRCGVCKTKCMFTAKEQKHAYEVEKRYIGQARIYCKACFSSLNEVLGKLKRADEQWAENKSQLSNDIAFLQHWLLLINELERLRPYRTNLALKQMIKNRLKKINS